MNRFFNPIVVFLCLLAVLPLASRSASAALDITDKLNVDFIYPFAPDPVGTSGTASLWTTAYVVVDTENPGVQDEMNDIDAPTNPVAWSADCWISAVEDNTNSTVEFATDPTNAWGATAYAAFKTSGDWEVIAQATVDFWSESMNLVGWPENAAYVDAESGGLSVIWSGNYDRGTPFVFTGGPNWGSESDFIMQVIDASGGAVDADSIDESFAPDPDRFKIDGDWDVAATWSKTASGIAHLANGAFTDIIAKGQAGGTDPGWPLGQDLKWNYQLYAVTVGATVTTPDCYFNLVQYGYAVQHGLARYPG